MACPVCRRWNTDGRTCIQVRCLACGTEQCHSNGTGNGCCKTCYHGMLPGWSGNNNPDRPGRYTSATRNDVLCGYKGCSHPAVYKTLPGSIPVACQKHGDKVIERKKTRRAEQAAEVQRRFSR